MAMKEHVSQSNSVTFVQQMELYMAQRSEIYSFATQVILLSRIIKLKCAQTSL